MNILKVTKVYIQCIAGVHSGGPELLHQLCFSLRQRGIDAYMFYSYTDSDPVHANYKKYHVPFIKLIEDKVENILIVPETATHYLYKFKHIRKVLWWLSVDNWLIHLEYILNSIRDSQFQKPILDFFYFQKDLELVHLVQSEYARNFLLLNNIDEGQIQYLSDYLNPLFIKKSKQNMLQPKENIVVYNPKKGSEFTKKLILQGSHLKWIPIIDMSPDEVASLLAKAKVYIDFGNHPGKDRIPREAAISGCCIITGKRGSAKYQRDVSIPIEYKFDDKEENIPAIIEKITFIMNNYQTEIQSFDAFRSKIEMERQEFEASVDCLFSSIIKETKTTIKAAILTITKNSDKIFDLLEMSEKYEIAYIVDEKLADKKLKYKDNLYQVISYRDAAWLYSQKGFDSFILPALKDNLSDEFILKNLFDVGISEKDIIYAPIDSLSNETLSIDERIDLFEPYINIKK